MVWPPAEEGVPLHYGVITIFVYGSFVDLFFLTFHLLFSLHVDN